MLSSAKVGTASWRYYSNSVAKGACEYYAGEGEAPGRWYGSGLGDLGLEPGGLVSEQQLEALFARAMHPATEEALGRRWRTDGVTGFDLTFSAPKSVSLVWALGDPPTRAQVTAAHGAAVQAGLAYLERHAALSRRGTDGSEQVRTAGLVATLFEHRTSRAGDPQLHTHALVLNKLRCADGQWRTVDGHEMYAHKRSAGAVYQSALRAELAQRLGVTFEERTANAQAEIAGIPKSLMRGFSKRTARITAEAAPVIAGYEQTLGRELTRSERAAVVKTAVVKTRPVKEHTDVVMLQERWAAEAKALGWDGAGLAAAARNAARRPRPPLPTVDEVLDGAVTLAGQRAAVFSRADLLVEVAGRIPVYAADAERIREHLEDLTDQALGRPDAVGLGAPLLGTCPRASDARYTTTELLAAEARVLQRAASARQHTVAKVPGTLAQLRSVEAWLDQGQREAVVRATNSGESISVWTAPAGAGKTTAIGVAARVWTEGGYEVMGLAPSARAAGELAKATGGSADTLAKWVHQQTRLHRMRQAEAARWAPTDRTVLIVDEAGMASTFDLDAVTAAAERVGAKVLLVGDPAQIGVINGPGGLLATLADRHGAAPLDEVHRFSQHWERAASLELRAGNPGALDDYAAAGRIHATTDADAALDAVFAGWAEARARGAEALMMAWSRVDVDALNARARAAAVQDGEVRGPAVAMGGRNWQTGDVLLARRNDRRVLVGDSHVRNGDRYRVINAVEDGLLVQRLDSQQRALLPQPYVAQHADYGWASTIDGAQGATTDVGILLARPGLDREHLYVGMTRGRQTNHVHVASDDTNLDENLWPPRPVCDEAAPTRQILVTALGRSGAQQAAHDVRDAALRAACPHRRSVVPEKVVARLDATAPAVLPPEHQRVLAHLAASQRERDALTARTRELLQDQAGLAAQHGRTRWWERGHRRALGGLLQGATFEMTSGESRLRYLDREIERLQATANMQAQQRIPRSCGPAEEQLRRERTRRPRLPSHDDASARLTAVVGRNAQSVAQPGANVAEATQMVAPTPPRRGIRR